MSEKNLFTCPKCGHTDPIFRNVCPACGRPFIRDYTDTQMHPKDPDLTGICTSRFWIWIFLILIIGGIILELGGVITGLLAIHP
jgi:hypothetical protein